MQENNGKKRNLQLLPHNINFQNMYSLGKLELTNVKSLVFSWKPNFSSNRGSRLYVLKAVLTDAFMADINDSYILSLDQISSRQMGIGAIFHYTAYLK